MSAFAGVLRFDGETVTRSDLERVGNTLKQYGPDRLGILAAGAVGLVHALMRMTPEDRFDRQPLQGPSGVLLAADARLDNRDEMLALIGVPPPEVLAWPDSRVLLAAWERFGDALWPMLRGPFAAVIWEPRRRMLTLARDHLGLNVVMWHRSKRFFAFATMPNGLFSLDAVPRELHEEKFADFLVLNHADHATTIYRNVFRVLPAHVMQVADNGSIKQRPYWSVADIKPVRMPSDQAYADGLRECLDRAVRRQLRSAHPVGCLLSGGLDSSAVCALAAGALAEKNERLAAYTGVPRLGFDGPAPPGSYVDETHFVNAIVRAVGSVDVTFVRGTESNVCADLDRLFVALAGPVRNPVNLGWMLAILRQARAQGRRVLLGGLYGNYTISWDGWSQTVAHLKHGRLMTALRQWHLYYRRTPYTRAAAMKKLIIEPLVGERLDLWFDRWRRRRRSNVWQEHAAINQEFAAATEVDRRARRVGHDFRYGLRQDERITGLTPVDYAGDWFAAEKAVTGVEVRDPTADIDVVSYCFGIPPEQYLAEGIDRSLIRRAMWGLLPQMVLTNRLSGLQAADWYEGLEASRDELSRQIAELAESALACRMIDLARLQRAIDNWPTGAWYTRRVFQEYGLALTRGVASGRFLRWFESSNRKGNGISVDQA
jgi:asparagine synthase (glutamine-hydrolysing)